MNYRSFVIKIKCPWRELIRCCFLVLLFYTSVQSESQCIEILVVNEQVKGLIDQDIWDRTCFPFWVSGVKRPLPREYPHHPPERDERERTRERERERKRIRESEEEHKGEGERKREKNNERERAPNENKREQTIDD